MGMGSILGAAVSGIGAAIGGQQGEPSSSSSSSASDAFSTSASQYTQDSYNTQDSYSLSGTEGMNISGGMTEDISAARQAQLLPGERGLAGAYDIYNTYGQRAMQDILGSMVQGNAQAAPIFQGSYSAYDKLLDSMSISRYEEGSQSYADYQQAKGDYDINKEAYDLEQNVFKKRQEDYAKQAQAYQQAQTDYEAKKSAYDIDQSFAGQRFDREYGDWAEDKLAADQQMAAYEARQGSFEGVPDEVLRANANQYAMQMNDYNKRKAAYEAAGQGGTFEDPNWVGADAIQQFNDEMGNQMGTISEADVMALGNPVVKHHSDGGRIIEVFPDNNPFAGSDMGASHGWLTENMEGDGSSKGVWTIQYEPKPAMMTETPGEHPGDPPVRTYVDQVDFTEQAPEAFDMEAPEFQAENQEYYGNAPIAPNYDDIVGDAPLAPTAPGFNDTMTDAQAAQQAIVNEVKAQPGYQFGLDEGLTALERSAASRGLLQSSGSQRVQQRYADDYASSRYQDYQQQLAGLSGMGTDMMTQLSGQQLAGGQAAANMRNQYSQQLAGLHLGGDQQWSVSPETSSRYMSALEQALGYNLGQGMSQSIGRGASTAQGASASQSQNHSEAESESTGSSQESGGLGAGLSAFSQGLSGGF